MNYDSLIKRVNKAIEKVESRMISSTLHVVDVDEDISELSGLIIIMHPDHESKHLTRKTT